MQTTNFSPEQILLKNVNITIINILLTLWCIAIYISVFFEFSHISHSYEKAITTTDFPAFYTAGKLVAEKIADRFYDPYTQFRVQKKYIPLIKDMDSQYAPYRNLPFFALILFPFSVFPFTVAYPFLVICNVLLVLLITSRICTAFRIRNVKLKITILLLLLGFPPIIETIVHTQPTLFLTLAFINVYLALKEKRYIHAGIWLSLFMIKFQFIIIPFISLIFLKKFKTVISFFLSSLFLLFISYLQIGFTGLRTFFFVTLDTLQWKHIYNLSKFYKHTLRGFLDALSLSIQNTDLYNLLLITLTLGALFCLLFLLTHSDLRWKNLLTLQWAAIGIASILLSPFAHFYDLSLLFVSNTLTTYWILENLEFHELLPFMFFYVLKHFYSYHITTFSYTFTYK